MKGMISSAISNEPVMVVTTVSGSTRMNLPAVAGRTISGRKANSRAAVQPRIARRLCCVPRKAASLRR